LEADSLVIWERIPTNPASKGSRVIGVFLDRAEIENPEILSMSVLEKTNDIFSAIAIDSL
jgi:hypothetical protein